MRAGVFEAVEELIEGFETGFFVEEAFVFERLGDLLDEGVASAGGVGKGSQNPDGRDVESKQAEQFDAVAGSALEQEIFELAFGRIDAFDAAYLLDKEAKSDADHHAVESGAANACGQKDYAGFLKDSAGEGAEGADDALG
jgi:hypothetical protein